MESTEKLCIFVGMKPMLSVMDNKEVFLTKDILGNLCLRVAKTLPCLKSLNDSTIWDKPIELCKRIEDNVREVDNMILEVRKDNGYFQNNSRNPLTFQVMLARVYILLYYRHADDELYKAMVFPVLQENMGIYSEKLLGDIQSMVKKVQEIDRLIAQSQQGKKQNSKPKYALICLSNGEADEYFSEFSNENLFRELSGYLENVRNHFFPSFDVSSIWLTAKDVVSKLWQERAPENFIDRLYHKLSISGDTGYVEIGAAEGVLLCGYAMMRTVTKSDHFHKAIAYIEEIPHQSNEYDLLYNEMGSLKEVMDNLSSSCTDYDYTGGAKQTVETFTKADVERILSESNEKYEKLKSDTSTIYNSLKLENEQLKKDKEQLKKSLAQSKDLTIEKEQKAANAYEKIIFFATALSVAYDDRFTNQTSLSNLICMVCGGSPSTYQPRISKLAKMAEDGKYEDEVINAAKNLIAKLKVIPKEDDKENPVIQKYIDSISAEFCAH